MLTFCIEHRAGVLYFKDLRFLQLRQSAASTVSQIVGIKPALRLLSGLKGKCFIMPYAPCNLPLAIIDKAHENNFKHSNNIFPI